MFEIAIPERDESRAAFRRVVEALSQLTPVTAALAHLYGYTHPSQFERDLERFWRDIAGSVNSHGERLARLEDVLASRTAISALALEVAFSILQSEVTGRGDSIQFETLCEIFADVEQKLVEEAVAELKHLAYAITTSALGHPILKVCPTTSMFLAFDLAATGCDTRSDAVQVARLWRGDESTHSIFRLNEILGWEPRRLNPALRILQRVFGDGRWSAEIHPTLETISVEITPEEQFTLRRIVQSGRVD